MARTLDIACLQTRPMPDFQTALDEAVPLADAAVQAGADFLFLPEYCGGLRSEGSALVPPSAPEAQHPFLKAFQDYAADKRVWIMLGSIAVTGPDNKIINRGYVIDDVGHIRSRYDKIHLFDIQISETEVYRESAYVVSGGRAVMIDTPFGRIGHTICYDLRFPHLYRELAQAGAEILCVPAAFTKKTGEAHWHVLNRARAIENGAYVIAPCAIGTVEGGGEAYGHSLVINPWGEVLADGGTIPGVVQASVDLDKVAETQARIPSLSHDRPFNLIGAADKSVA